MEDGAHVYWAPRCAKPLLSVKYNQELAFAKHLMSATVLGDSACSFNLHGSSMISIFMGGKTEEREEVTCWR